MEFIIIYSGLKLVHLLYIRIVRPEKKWIALYEHNLCEELLLSELVD